MTLTRRDFPEGFLFGAATAAYQIEGSSFGNAGLSHWDTFAATPGNVVRAENGAIACDHYNRWESDLDLLKEGNFDAYRFSTSWSRVMPEGRGLVNPEGMDFYDRLVDGMLARGLKPCLTLYHWDLPAALAMKGGWMNRDIAGWFADYAAVVMDRLGDRVAMTATINEPWCVAWLSHFMGVHAPGLRDIHAAAHAMHHVLLAHGLAVQALRAEGAKNLGIVLNFDHCTPASQSPEDLAATATADAIFNRWFIEGITQGIYPAEAMAGLMRHMPHGWHRDMGLISQSLDWLGVNYYTRHIHGHDADAPWPSGRVVEGKRDKTSMGWEIYPEGLEGFLTRMSKEYVGDLPIYITENGMAWNDVVENGAVYDPQRSAYIDSHLAAVKQAMKAGANIQGFFYWSLLDNYEWAQGYDKRFGLIHVDFDSLKRIPKASYHALARALAR
jgi:beta-glucosidase